MFDCGTGARSLGQKLLRDGKRELELVFTHFHMDHVFGFPFFAPIYTPGYRIRVSIPAFSEDEARERLSRFLNGIYHPTRLRNLPADVSFSAIRPARDIDRAGWKLKGFALNHPGGSVGYRADADGQSMAYVTDTSPFARPGEGVAAGEPPTAREKKALEWLRGCDLVIYDTMYDVEEYLEKMTWGHSYPEYAIALCREAGVKHLVLFHHNPDDDDDQLDVRAARYQSVDGMRVTLAREGETVTVPAREATSTSS